MIRRWRGGHAVVAVVDETVAFMPGPPPTTSTSERNVDELAALREKASKLQARLTEEIVRANNAERALDNQNELLDYKDQIIAVLRGRALDKKQSGTSAGDWDGVEREPKAGTEAAHWYRIAHELQERNRQLQAANEARDRAPAGWRR